MVAYQQALLVDGKVAITTVLRISVDFTVEFFTAILMGDTQISDRLVWVDQRFNTSYFELFRISFSRSK